MSQPRSCPRVRSYGRLLLIAAVFVQAGAWLWGQQLMAASPQAAEYEVKAAFLLNFTRFIEWPPADRPADAPFGLCVLGEDPFGTVLDQLVEGERVDGRRLVVRRVREASNSCDVLFFPKSESSRGLSEMRQGVLTVGESEDFLRQGGMISFIVENRRVRFDINLRAASRAGLQISSKLLNVARKVER